MGARSLMRGSGQPGVVALAVKCVHAIRVDEQADIGERRGQMGRAHGVFGFAAVVPGGRGGQLHAVGDELLHRDGLDPS